MYGRMTHWCHERGVKSIGHFMEHGCLYVHPEFCAGDMMRLQRYSDMGGIDAVFDQFVIGKRVVRDHPTWQTPKLASSISHVFGKPDDTAMVEIFGARGQDLTYSEMKWWTDHMQVSGVSFFIPHSFNPRSPYDQDCPPYFYNGGYEPRWPLYRVFADYTSRLSLMLTGGRHVCPIALLFGGNTQQVGKAIMPEEMTTALQDAQFDCDWVPFDVFERDVSLNGRQANLYEERYRVLIVPPVEVIPHGALAKAKQFFDNGGVIVGYGFLPSKSATIGKHSADIAALCREIWGDDVKPRTTPCKTNAAGGRSYLLSQVPTSQEVTATLAADAGVHPALELLGGQGDNWLHVLHRQKAKQDIFFVCNQNHQGTARQFTFRATAQGEPECWDAMRNEITALPFDRIDVNTVKFALTMEPLESMLIVFQPKQTARPPRVEPGTTPVREPIILVREPKAVPPKPPAKKVKSLTKADLAGSKWIWFPEGNPASDAPPGVRYFRHTITIPADRNATLARFLLTADNAFNLYVNGNEVDNDSHVDNDEWKRLRVLDFTKYLQAGSNVVTIAAINGGQSPNPAGLLGRFIIDFKQGPLLTGTTDKTWKTSKQEENGWKSSKLDDSAWVAAKEVANVGDGPWGSPWGPPGSRPMTVSSIAVADPYRAQVVIPADVDVTKCRIFLEMEGLPDDSAAVTVNGKSAGGVLGKPSRLDLTCRLKAGNNTIQIEPLAPASARLVFY
jgi:hypothetical protein